MNREGKKCVLYPRVSTEMQVDGYSLEGQKNGLKRFADREEMEIVGIYEDAGKSGKSIEGRPAFKKMLSDIGNGLEIVSFCPVCARDLYFYVGLCCAVQRHERRKLWR